MVTTRWLGHRGQSIKNVRIFAAAIVAAFLSMAVGVSSSSVHAAGPSTSNHHLVASAPSLDKIGALPSLGRVDAGQVQDCVDLVQFGAWTGNKSLLKMWDDAGRNVPKLRQNCEAIGRTNPATLTTLSKQWQDIKKWIASVNARPHVTSQPKASPSSCSGGYINVDGNCIPSPTHAPSAPSGSAAKRRDGTYSFSQHRQGTCSHHGGVATWL